MITEEIIQLLPYSEPFLFVESLQSVQEDGVVGTYTFDANADFYRGHFKDFPVTPGVILTETMAQIGLVCLGIYLLKDKGTFEEFPKIALSSQEVEFYHPVFPGERVEVTSEKIYFRFGKLKCKVEMKNQKGEVVCKGVMAGMMKLK